MYHFKNDIAISEYDTKRTSVSIDLKKGNNGIIYLRYESDKGKDGKLYVGKTIRSIEERNNEHTDSNGVCSKMTNPEITDLAVVYGSHQTILHYEKLVIQELVKREGKRVINVYNGDNVKKNYVAELPIVISPVKPKLYSGTDRFMLKIDGKDIFNRKFGKDKEKALEKMMIFINENYKNGVQKMF